MSKGKQRGKVWPVMSAGKLPKASTPKVQPRTMNDLTVKERLLLEQTEQAGQQ